MKPDEEAVTGWEDYVLHNPPFYSVESIPDQAPVEEKTVKVTKIIKSVYELSKSAAFWQYQDFMDR